MEEEVKTAAEENLPLKADKFHDYAVSIANGECGEFIYCFEGITRFYFYENGYWQPLGEEEFLSIIQDRLIREKKVKTKDEDGNEEWKTTKGKILTTFIPSRKKQVIEHFKLIKNIKLEQLNKFPFINFENNMFDPENMNVFKHGSEYFSTIRVPYKHQLLAECPLWLKTIKEIMEDDLKKINSLQQFFGYCLLPNTKFKKALLLLGETDTGKSTILNILRNVLGEKNCSSVPLKCFSKDNQIPNMIGKLVNIDADVSKDAAEYEAGFKIITSGDPIHCDPKYIQPFDFIPKCKIVLAANEFPKITDHSSAFYNRLILIPLTRRFLDQEINRELPQQLLTELPGILNWTIEGLRQIIKNGGFNIHGYIKEAIQELEDDNNPVNLFFEEHIGIEIGVFITKRELYDKFSTWAKVTNNYALSENRFSNCVYKKYQKQTPKNARLEGGGKRIWRNIQYYDNKGNMPIKTEVNWQDVEPPAVLDKTASPSTIAAEGGKGDISEIKWDE